MSFDYSQPIDAAALFEICADLSRRGAELFFIGRSLLGVPLPCIRIGEGDGRALFVGSHHGMEHITSNILLKFADECLSESFLQARDILNLHTLFIVPMLNPDGVAIARGGVSEEHPLFEYLKKINGTANFSHWQANARGVDLNHNYDAGFSLCKEAERALGITSPSPTRYGGERPESEPETAALCALTRKLSPRLKTVVALHTQGEEIYFDYEKRAPSGALALAEKFAAASGYTVCRPETAASHGGYKDWVIDKFDIPAFTVECGMGTNPLPSGDFDDIYRKVRKVLILAANF